MGQDPWGFFAARLAELLRASGLTQIKAAQLASRQSVGPGAPPVMITNGQISAWVRRENRPSQTALKQLTRVLIDRARRIDTRLVSEDKGPRTYSEGLLDERNWPKWLQAAHGPAAPAGLPTVREADPTALGVHRAAAVRPHRVSAEEHRRGSRLLTPYLIREHDHLLRNHLAVAAQGGPSVFTLLLGESTTGKTRALYEAVLEQAPDHTLLHPLDAEDLQQLLADGALLPGTVLWLNETQRYLQGEAGSSIAKQLTRRLTQVAGIVMVGAMWRTPYFTALTAQGRPLDHGATRDLLHGQALVLDVPDALTPAQCEELRTLATGGVAGPADRRVIDALDAGVKEDGRVIQHLSGGPELLTAYCNRTLFTPVEHALITAALDLRRLGHNQPLPTQLLAEAADGYLTVRTRPSEPDWATTALDDLTRGCRGGDSRDRTDVRHTLTALTRHVTRSGTPPVFEPADYLDQHTRPDRQDQLGPATLWDALAAHTADPADLHRLARAAKGRGLLKTAVVLYRKASLEGDPHAPADLIQLLAMRHLDSDQHAACWVASRAALSDALGVARLLSVLKEAGAEKAVRQLSTRAAACEDLTNPAGVAYLLSELTGAGVEETVRQLSTRAAACADLTSRYGVARLLSALKEAGAEKALRQLSTRAAARVDLTNPSNVAELLSALKEGGAEETVQELLARQPATSVNLTDPDGVASLLSVLKRVGAEKAVKQLLARQPATSVNLTDPDGVASLLSVLKRVGAE
ncbi:hypothetical protein ACIQW3_31410, partial [Streptomyces lavendulae]